MIKIVNKNEFKVGDKVWYFDAWGNLQNGVIYEIVDDHAKTKEGLHGGVLAGAKLDKCWPSKEDCLYAENCRAVVQKAEYKESIKSVEDLVRFLYQNDVNSEYRDEEARKAAKERAEELGIRLD